MKYIIGIDEVGRGSLAGPLMVSAVCVPFGMRLSCRKLGKLKDSKKLTWQTRELWLEYFSKKSGLSFACAKATHATIDRINVSNAANRAALRAFLAVTSKNGIDPGECTVLLDGGLYLGSRQALSGLARRVETKTVIKGDEKIPAISAASIIAKVQRDRLMVRLAKKYPQYGFDLHKGYATSGHRRAIRACGMSEIHRLSFMRKILS
jgi:ribonuclease HII